MSRQKPQEMLKGSPSVREKHSELISVVCRSTRASKMVSCFYQSQSPAERSPEFYKGTANDMEQAIYAWINTPYGGMHVKSIVYSWEINSIPLVGPFTPFVLVGAIFYLTHARALSDTLPVLLGGLLAG